MCNSTWCVAGVRRCPARHDYPCSTIAHVPTRCFCFCQGLFSSGITLENLELRAEAVPAHVPFALKHGRIGKLSIKFNVLRIRSQPIEVCLEDVHVVVTPRGSRATWDAGAVGRALDKKKQKLCDACDRRSAKSSAGRATGGIAASIKNQIVDNLQFTLRGLHVRCEEEYPNDVGLCYAARGQMHFTDFRRWTTKGCAACHALVAGMRSSEAHCRRACRNSSFFLFSCGRRACASAWSRCARPTRAGGPRSTTTRTRSRTRPCACGT